MKSYFSVLSTPGAWRFLLPAFLARLPYAMLQIGILLLVRWATGSYGAAGIASAAAAVCQAFIGPQTGRLADRYGQARVLVPQVGLHAAALGLLLTLAQDRASVVPLVVTSALVGASMPQVGSMVRARWANLLGGDGRLATAFAVESITDELTFTLAPVFLVALATGFSPVWALAVALVLVIVGTLGFAAVGCGAPKPIPVKASRRTGVLRMGGILPLAVAFLSVGTVFGSLQLGVTSFTAALGQPGAAGPIYATFSAASMIGGLVYGARRWRLAASKRLLIALGVLVMVSVVPSFADSIPIMYGAVALAGFAIAPAIITGYALVERLVIPEVRTEAYTLLNGAIGLGIATGAAVAGRLVDGSGPSTAFLVPPVTTGLAVIVVRLRLRSLTPATEAAETRELVAA